MTTTSIEHSYSCRLLLVSLSMISTCTRAMQELQTAKQGRCVTGPHIRATGKCAGGQNDGLLHMSHTSPGLRLSIQVCLAHRKMLGMCWTFCSVVAAVEIVLDAVGKTCWACLEDARKLAGSSANAHSMMVRIRYT